MVIVIIVFIAISAITAHKLALGMAVRVKSANEELLRTYLSQYNNALLRFYIVEKKWPRDINELLSAAGYLRKLSPDPFTKKSNYLLIDKNGQKYIVSACAEKSIDGFAYNTLCVDSARKFVRIDVENPPSLVKLMCPSALK